MDNKSSMGRVIDNTPGGLPPMVTATPSGPGPSVGDDGTNRYQFQTGTGYEGPGVGSAKRLNSDNAPVGPSYPNA